jgi:KUP system potassium uptake protein
MNTTVIDNAAPAGSGGPQRQGVAALTLGAMGVVYGDIGTSPLYTVKEVFAPHTGVPLDPLNLIGAVSVTFWALMLVVTLKYVILILRADNHGEGGGLALAALAAQSLTHRPRAQRVVLLMGVAGATLFYGDSIITPAISVLGAMEGLELVTPTLKDAVVPITVVILVAVFLVQRFGTHVVGRFFGPIVVMWFVMLGGIGIVHIVQEPGILAALNPMRAWEFLMARGWLLLAAVGAIVLALTGAEALYADLGHFGRRPIRLAWTGLVLPGLALNYLGQGALLMHDPSAIENPFYRLFPDAWVLPALVLATLAAIIASQAVISGAYSLTRQAIQLGFLPRLTVRHTSARESGQIYMPAVNGALLVGVLVAVLAFGSSSALAGAYGIAATLTMLITTLLTYVVVRERWRLPAPVAIGATLFFVAIDLLLVAGCAVKFFDGGWFPLALGAVIFLLMATWWSGRGALLRQLRQDGLELKPFVESLDVRTLPRATRTAVYPVADPSTVPAALLHNLKHNQVLHERNVILSVVFEPVPWVPMERRVVVEPLGKGFWQVTMHFGFMNTPDVPRALELTRPLGLHVPVFETTFFLSRRTLEPAASKGWARWRQQLFAAMARNAAGADAFFRLPGNAVVELGTRVRV